MHPLNRIEATRQLDTQVRLALECLEAQREEITAMHESIKERNNRSRSRSLAHTQTTTTKTSIPSIASIVTHPSCAKPLLPSKEMSLELDASKGVSTSATSTNNSSGQNDDLLQLNVEAVCRGCSGAI